MDSHIDIQPEKWRLQVEDQNVKGWRWRGHGFVAKLSNLGYQRRIEVIAYKYGTSEYMASIKHVKLSVENKSYENRSKQMFNQSRTWIRLNKNRRISHWPGEEVIPVNIPSHYNRIDIIVEVAFKSTEDNSIHTKNIIVPLYKNEKIVFRRIF